MKALHFGAGNIGRGFIGKLLADSQIDVIFADVNQAVIDLLNQTRSYPVKIVGEQSRIEQVRSVSGVNSRDENALIPLFNQVDLITTAVGPDVLKIIAKTIAQGLTARFNAGNQQAINIIACENRVRASSLLKEQVFAYLSPAEQQQAQKRVGFVDSAVDRIVPPVQASTDKPLLVTVEEFSEWIVDKTQFKGEIPAIKGMELSDNLMAFVERKLFTLNTGHAVTAYAGKLKGYQFVRQAIEDTDIYAFVKAVMQESGAVLIQRYQFDPKAHAAYIDKILKRFANPYLQDEVDRVGREPLRKLSPNDRLIKPLQGALAYQLPHQHLIQAVAYALAYRNEQDPQAIELAHALRQQGVAETLYHYTQLSDPALVQAITQAYNKLQYNQ